MPLQTYYDCGGYHIAEGSANASDPTAFDIIKQGEKTLDRSDIKALLSLAGDAERVLRAEFKNGQKMTAEALRPRFQALLTQGDYTFGRPSVKSEPPREEGKRRYE